jgi:hypothetical protein
MISRRNLNVWLTICSLMVVLVSAAEAQTLHVPDEYGTIQDAINEALAGDEIEVAPGTYFEAINFNGKAIRLYSSGGPAVTTIDATGIVDPVSVVTCTNGEVSGTILEGFTITGGRGTLSYLGKKWGGGMFNDDSSPTVDNCTFSDNTADAGGGMANRGCSPTITNCTFSDNTADAGGGMFNGEIGVVGSTSKVRNCIFSGNDAAWGGGMWNYMSSPTVINCTFSNNTGSIPGMYNESSSDPTVTNCILWGNGSVGQYQIVNVSNSTADVTYSDVQLGTGEPWFGTGCIDADPMFRDALNGDYRLLSGSPCIDVGNNAAVPADVTTDLDGKPRIVNDTVDMGAFEAQLGPAELLLKLMQTVINLNLQHGISNSLDAKLSAAMQALDDINENNDVAAINTLQAFINAVEAQRGSKIPEVAADALIDSTQVIIDLLSME